MAKAPNSSSVEITIDDATRVSGLLMVPSSPKACLVVAHGAAAAAAGAWVPSLPLIAGGKSFGGRMTSQAQAAQPMDGVRGLVFLGFPLHPPKQPSDSRGHHLSQVQIPMLFLQGARDAYAELSQIEPLVKRLGGRAALCILEDADHSFRVPARGLLTGGQINDKMLDTLAAWVDALTA